MTGARRAETPLRGRRVTVRPAAAGDAAMLARWHLDPEVRRYWDDETPSEEELLAMLADPDLDPYIVEADGEPVGYLQAWFDAPTGSAGLDMYLLAGARGRGLGPEAARTLARHLLETAGMERVTVDPYVWNERAVRAWRRAGFRPVEERPADEDHATAWLLMELTEVPPDVSGS